ncbi:MAG: hypothetical protein ACO2ZM_05300 [Francisellaceae bacterium]
MKQSKTVKLSSLLLTTALLAACGGGGGSSSDTDDSNNDPSTPTIVPATAIESISVPNAVITDSTVGMEIVVTAEEKASGFNIQGVGESQGYTHILGVTTPKLSDGAITITNGDEKDACWNTETQKGAELDAGDSCVIELEAASTIEQNIKDAIEIKTSRETLSVPFDTSFIAEEKAFANDNILGRVKLDGDEISIYPHALVKFTVENPSAKTLNNLHIAFKKNSPLAKLIGERDSMRLKELKPGHTATLSFVMPASVWNQLSESEKQALGSNAQTRQIAIKAANMRPIIPEIAIKSSPLSFEKTNLQLNTTSKSYTLGLNNPTRSSFHITAIHADGVNVLAESLQVAPESQDLIFLKLTPSSKPDTVLTIDYEDDAGNAYQLNSDLDIDNRITPNQLTVQNSILFTLNNSQSTILSPIRLTNESEFVFHPDKDLSNYRIENNLGDNVAVASLTLDDGCASEDGIEPGQTCSLWLSAEYVPLDQKTNPLSLIMPIYDNLTENKRIPLYIASGEVAIMLHTPMPSRIISGQSLSLIAEVSINSQDIQDAVKIENIDLPEGFSMIEGQPDSCEAGGSFTWLSPNSPSCRLYLRYTAPEIQDNSEAFDYNDKLKVTIKPTNTPITSQQDIKFKVVPVTDSDLETPAITKAVDFSPKASASVVLKNDTDEPMNNAGLVIANWLAPYISNLPEAVQSLQPGESHRFTITLPSADYTVNGISFKQQILTHYQSLLSNGETGEVIRVGSANLAPAKPDLMISTAPFIAESTSLNRTNSTIDLKNITDANFRVISIGSSYPGVEFEGAADFDFASQSSVSLPMKVSPSVEEGQHGELVVEYKDSLGRHHVAIPIYVDTSLNADDITITGTTFHAPMPGNTDTLTDYAILTNNGVFGLRPSTDEKNYFGSLPEGGSFDRAMSTCTDGTMVMPGASCRLAFRVSNKADGQKIHIALNPVNNLVEEKLVDISISAEPIAVSVSQPIPSVMKQNSKAFLSLKLSNHGDKSVDITTPDSLPEGVIFKGSDCAGSIEAGESCQLNFSIMPDVRDGQYRMMIPLKVDGKEINTPIAAKIVESNSQDLESFELNYPDSGDLSIQAGDDGIVSVVNNGSEALNNVHFVLPGSLADHVLPESSSLTIPYLEAGDSAELKLVLDTSAEVQDYIDQNYQALSNNDSSQLIAVTAANAIDPYPIVNPHRLINMSDGITPLEPGLYSYPLESDSDSALRLIAIDDQALSGTGVSILSKPEENAILGQDSEIVFNFDDNAKSSAGIGITVEDVYGNQFDLSIPVVLPSSTPSIEEGVVVLGSNPQTIKIFNKDAFPLALSHDRADYTITASATDGQMPKAVNVLDNSDNRNSCLNYLNDTLIKGNFCELEISATDADDYDHAYSLNIKADDGKIMASQDFQVVTPGTLYSQYDKDFAHYSVKRIEVGNNSDKPANLGLTVSSGFSIYNGNNAATGIGPWCTPESCPDSCFNNGVNPTLTTVTIEPEGQCYVYTHGDEVAIGDMARANLEILVNGNDQATYQLSQSAQLIAIVRSLNNVYTWDGSKWSNLIDHANSVGNFFADEMVVNAQGDIYFTDDAYYYVDNKNKKVSLQNFSFMKWDGRDFSVYLSGDDVVNPNGMIRDMLFDREGNIYIGINKGKGLKDNPDATLLKFDGNSWQPITIPEGAMDTPNSMAYDPNKNRLYLSTLGKSENIEGAPAYSFQYDIDSGQFKQLAKPDISSSYPEYYNPLNIDKLGVSSDGSLYAGGIISRISGVSEYNGFVNNITRFDNGQWHPLVDQYGKTGVNNKVYNMAADGQGNLYVQGAFTKTGQMGYQYLAKWQPVSGTWQQMIGNSSLRSTDIQAMYADPVSGYLYVSGKNQYSLGSGAGVNFNYWNGSSWQSMGLSSYYIDNDYKNMTKLNKLEVRKIG